MRSIAIINQKGGVGKTTTTVNLSAALSQEGRSVLLLDFDPQSHATIHLGIELGPEDLSVYDVLARGVPLADVARGLAENLVVIPAHLDLVGAEVELAAREQRETVLARALNPYQQGFDFCLVDCPPSLGLLTINALAAVEEVIIPLQPHFLALQGLGRLLETVSLVRQSLNPALRVSGIVLCMFESGTRLAQEVSEDVRRFVARADRGEAWYGARVFATIIRRNIKLAECPSFGRTIFDYAPTCHGAQDYRALTRELLATGGAVASPAGDSTSAQPAATAQAVAASSSALPEPRDSRAEDPATL